MNTLSKTLAHYTDVMAELEHLPTPSQFMTSLWHTGEFRPALYFYDSDSDLDAARDMLAWLDHFAVDAVTLAFVAGPSVQIKATIELGGAAANITANTYPEDVNLVRDALGVHRDLPDREPVRLATARLREVLRQLAVLEEMKEFSAGPTVMEILEAEGGA